MDEVQSWLTHIKTAFRTRFLRIYP